MKTLFPDLGIKTGAVFSDCRKYRYRLWRVWDETKPILVGVLQNPSTADEEVNDPTITRFIGFARQDDYGGVMVLNAMAYRATDERELLTVDDPVGPLNWIVLKNAMNTPDGANWKMGPLVAAWGNRMMPKTNRHVFQEAYRKAAEICVAQGAYCFGTNKSGDPKHPLFLPGDTELVKWTMPEY